jgi:cytochrome b involved in lipid metabolism
MEGVIGPKVRLDMMDSLNGREHESIDDMMDEELEMRKLKIAKSNAEKKKKKGDGVKEIGLEELGMHKSSADAWIAVNGWVFDISYYHSMHPGGSAIILQYAGTDASEMFREMHDWVQPRDLLKGKVIGKFVG